MQVKKSTGDIPVRYIKGVGPRKADLFAKLGIENVSDLFYYLPRRYEDRSSVVEVKDLKPGQTQAVVGRVLKTSVFTARTGTRIFEMAVGDDTSRVVAVWYNQPFMKKVFSQGQTVVLYGKIERARRFQINHPAFEILDGENLKDSLDVGRIVPFYSLTEKLTQRYMRKIVHQAISFHISAVKDPLPTKIRARKKLVDSRFSIENIHFPYSPENLERAYKRLVFEEFFILQVIMALRRRKIREKGITHQVREGLLAEFEKLFDFKFTGEQKKCIKDIEEDMSGEKTMYRLLQGDVGSGKTVVAMYALLLTARNGYQGVLMVPTEVLARQHYVTVSKTFMPLGLNVRLLINGIDRKDREKVKEELAGGEADIVIGTHALIQEDIDYSDLGLAVIDEQHKFGVAQRKTLRRKGVTPDTLVMTATPIPRSLVLTVFGDMDISLLKEKPEDREPVTTYWVGEDRREAVYDFIRDEVSKGRQAFIVYPRIKKTDRSDLKSAEEMYERLREEIFRDLRVAIVHGRLKREDKKKVMEDFRAGEYDILIATTVIEVGVDIPNVTVMLVEHAERYGLAQLHQLRGRIGRGKHTSYCILMGEPRTEVSLERLSTMAETDDGFQIAERDLDLRGPGEFLGTRQSGLPELRFGNIARDFKIMEEAREEAFDLVKVDPGLKDPRNAGIKESITERFRGKLGI
ncbi:MAG: ATP-dependent DNA helicase RecG [Candidatus Omnitrophota bacterium]|nr:ATP-dependent DNA helicase RecG [Candidatus Omnitrophota bacterium]